MIAIGKKGITCFMDNCKYWFHDMVVDITIVALQKSFRWRAIIGCHFFRIFNLRPSIPGFYGKIHTGNVS